MESTIHFVTGGIPHNGEGRGPYMKMFSPVSIRAANETNTAPSNSRSGCLYVKSTIWFMTGGGDSIQRRTPGQTPNPATDSPPRIDFQPPSQMQSNSRLWSSSTDASGCSSLKRLGPIVASMSGEHCPVEFKMSPTPFDGTVAGFSRGIFQTHLGPPKPVHICTACRLRNFSPGCAA